MDIFDSIQNTGDKPEAGKALISEPFLFDTNFKRSVILLCEHDEENGTLGFILNRKLDATLDEVMEIETSMKIPLYLGGPVQKNTLHYIHRDEEHLKDSIDLGNGIFWGGNFEELVPMIEMGVLDLDKYRFFLGYSGWGKGQLDDELEIKSWIVTDISQSMVFGDITNGALWKDALNNLGGSYKILAKFPESPFLN
jgi:putative transcriptional regulator